MRSYAFRDPLLEEVDTFPTGEAISTRRSYCLQIRFGAGFMIALCHDERVMRQDRGFLCANEIELGMTIPEPELALFRHKIPMPAFFQTIQLARRRTGPDALATGIVQQVTDLSAELPSAIERAQRLAHLGKNRTKSCNNPCYEAVTGGAIVLLYTSSVNET